MIYEVHAHYFLNQNGQVKEESYPWIPRECIRHYVAQENEVNYR